MIISSDHFFLTCTNDIKEIAKPLLSLGITYFSYSRHYHNGSRIWLTTSPENLESYYRNKAYLIGNSESHPKNYHSQIALWSALPNQKVFEASKQLGIDHGIFIIEPQDDFCEFFAFATTNENYHIINTYLTHIDFLKKFGNYFKDVGKSLINGGEENKLILPYHNTKISSVNSVDLTSILDINLKTTKLSHQQYACAQLLLQGKSYKEIAKHCSLSHRTVETYINNLKNKLHCENRTELILKLTQYIDNKA